MPRFKHEYPHEPQLVIDDDVLVSHPSVMSRLQSAVPAAQWSWHTPLTHDAPLPICGHVTPHPPQLSCC